VTPAVAHSSVHRASHHRCPNDVSPVDAETRAAVVFTSNTLSIASTPSATSRCPVTSTSTNPARRSSGVRRRPIQPLLNESHQKSAIRHVSSRCPLVTTKVPQSGSAQATGAEDPRDVRQGHPRVRRRGAQERSAGVDADRPAGSPDGSRDPCDVEAEPAADVDSGHAVAELEPIQRLLLVGLDGGEFLQVLQAAEERGELAGTVDVAKAAGEIRR
jgi:hypothetical protein